MNELSRIIKIGIKIHLIVPSQDILIVNEISLCCKPQLLARYDVNLKCLTGLLKRV